MYNLCITVYFETRMGIAAGYSVLLFITTGLRCLGSRGQRNVGHMTQVQLHRMARFREADCAARQW